MHLPPPPPASPPFIWWWWWWVEKEGCRTTAPECKQTGRTEITLLPLFIVVLRSCHSFGPSLARIKCSVLSPPYYEFTDKVDCFLLVSLLVTTFQQAKGEKKKTLLFEHLSGFMFRKASEASVVGQMLALFGEMGF